MPDLRVPREWYEARNAAEAERTAHRIVAKLLESYFGIGQPENEAEDAGVPRADARRLRTALERIRRDHLSKSAASAKPRRTA